MARETENVRYEEEFILNAKGVKIFTCRWKPLNVEPKALIFLCHGYGMECSITMHSTAMRLAKAGFAVYGMDYQGHGKSAGLFAYITSFDDLVNDVSSHYTSICEREENKEKVRFLVGESMGGAVVLLLHRKNPDFWDGAVLVAPMCKIADELRPHPLVISVLTKLTKIIPTWKIVPTNDIIDFAFKEPEVRDQVRKNPYCYKNRPRLKTAYELLKVSLDLEKRLHEITIPVLVLHGGEDKVTDKGVSQQLYEVASSCDKTFKLYPGMWHGLLYGEPPENLHIVFSDIIEWLDDRASCSRSSRFENEHKSQHDAAFLGRPNKPIKLVKM